MKHHVAVTEPFDLAQSLRFMQRFPPMRDTCALTGDRVTAAVALDGRAVPFTLSAAPSGGLAVETEDARCVEVARDLVGATDDLAPFYAAAAGDPAMAARVAALHGLHHVRFLTLGEIAVYAVLMQRAPMAMAARMKQKFLARFGLPVVPAGALRAMPELAQLCALDEGDIAEAIGHRRKAAMIAEVVRGVAAIGEAVLRTAPYEAARDRLLAIRGVGPFSAAAILLRGLGRMDELPWMASFDEAGRALYGSGFDRAQVEARYGRHIGYWSFYAKVGVA